LGHDGPDAVEAFTERFEAAGFDVLRQGETACCYSVQTKVWVQDPDGHRWEVFARLSDDAAFHEDTPLDGGRSVGSVLQAQMCCGDAQAKVDAGDACCGPEASETPEAKSSGCCA